jgi:MerR family transcriptional regulator, copper efflux regulator
MDRQLHAANLDTHRTRSPGGGVRRSIGQAAQESGVSAKMIRYYESIGLIGAAGRSGANYRFYDTASVQTLRFIARARSLGFSIDEIARLLALWREPERNSADVKALALAHVAELDARIAALQEMKQAIEALTEQCHGDERPECPIISDLSGGRRAASDAQRGRSDG